MNILPAALAGMGQAEARVDRTATKIAAWGTPAGDRVDLSAEMVSLMEARTEFEAGAGLVGVAGGMAKRLLDVLG